MSERKNDRHKAPRHYQSGSEKRLKAKEKEKLKSKVLSQTRRLTDYMMETSKIVTPSENREIERNVRFENSANVSIKLDSEAGNNITIDAATNTAPEEIKIVHYDTCDLSSTFLHGVKLGPERSEGPNNAVQSAP